MRSVHEIDTLRPLDTKSHIGAPGSTAGTPASKVQRIRLKLSHPAKEGTDIESHIDATIPTLAPTEAAPDPEELTMPEFGPELGFDEHELALPPQELYNLLRRQIKWAENEGAKLRNQWDEIRPKRELAWLEKEAVLDDVIDGELRLFSAIVGATEAGADASNLEKLQQQQLQFQRQNDQAKLAAANSTTA